MKTSPKEYIFVYKQNSFNLNFSDEKALYKQVADTMIV